MTNDEIIQYYDYLMRLATSKCNSQADAEDLVGDTMLAAFSYMQKGGIIEHPKTWLAHTLSYKHNDNLRKKYRVPVMVYLEDGIDIIEDEDEEYLSTEDAAKVRKELNCLANITREVLIRYYYGNQSVSDIAEGLGIPEGTVKSRLFAGRNQIKKGFETMETKENYLPGDMYLSYGGSFGLNFEPMSLVENDLIAKNLLILAYEKPITISELAKAIGIPSAYIEPIIKKLVDGELMVRMDSGKVYSDFIITKSQNLLRAFTPQLDFAHKHFEKIWGVIEVMSEQILGMPCVQNMSDEEKNKLNRYAVLKTLQDFQSICMNRHLDFPKRKDGGRWFAHAIAFEAGYDNKQYTKAEEYGIRGHRSIMTRFVGEAKKVSVCEFETTLCDTMRRYGNMRDLYVKNIAPLLWHIYSDMPLKNSGIPNEFIEYMPTLEAYGMISSLDGKPCLTIPVFTNSEYEELCSIIKNATKEMVFVIGEKYTDFISSMKTPLPQHLTSVPEFFRYIDATNYFVMAIVREAYDKGLHLKGVNYCCPPVILVYEK